jgi:hypothetical protein
VGYAVLILGVIEGVMLLLSYFMLFKLAPTGFWVIVGFFILVTMTFFFASYRIYIKEISNDEHENLEKSKQHFFVKVIVAKQLEKYKMINILNYSAIDALLKEVEKAQRHEQQVEQKEAIKYRLKA